jgi:hypothetical protein
MTIVGGMDDYRRADDKRTKRPPEGGNTIWKERGLRLYSTS